MSITGAPVGLPPHVWPGLEISVITCWVLVSKIRYQQVEGMHTAVLNLNLVRTKFSSWIPRIYATKFKSFHPDKFNLRPGTGTKFSTRTPVLENVLNLVRTWVRRTDVQYLSGYSRWDAPDSMDIC
eukprot:SAG31_NODE_17176_length_680_cov_1.237522_1_plen_126_part_00